MKNETLEKIKKDFEYKRTETDNFNEKVKRIAELEKDPRVKEYSELLKSIIGVPRIISLSDDDICGLAFRQHAAEIMPCDTNGIYVYMGAFRCNPSKNGIEVREYGDMSLADYKKYWDIELGTVTYVDLNKSEQFENEHFIIFSNGENESNVFRMVQDEFIKEAIEHDQTSALKLIYKKYGDKDRK